MSITTGIPGHSPLQHSRLLHDLTDRRLLAVSHDVYPADAFDLADLLDQLDADLATLEFRLRGALEALDNRVGGVNPRDVAANPQRGTRRRQRADAGQYEALLQQSEIARFCHENPKLLDIVNV